LVQEGEVRLNDGRCDHQGRFIAGGYNGDERGGGDDWPRVCGVYIVEPKGTQERSGLCFHFTLGLSFLVIDVKGLTTDD
jgi:sugar lactone lactonase YvrE